VFETPEFKEYGIGLEYSYLLNRELILIEIIVLIKRAGVLDLSH